MLLGRQKLNMLSEVKLVTNLIHNEMHDCFWNNVTLRFVNNLQVRVDKITNCFHLSFQLGVQ